MASIDPDTESTISSVDLQALRLRLRAGVRRACPRWLASDAEDIVQNALMQLLRKLKKSDGKMNFSSMYLAMAAHGATVDEIRRRTRRKELPGEERMMERAISERADPERESAARELGRGIQYCLGSMVAPRRLAVTVHLQGGSVPETAKRFHWTVTKAENLVYRGLRDLRECLASKGMAP